MLNPAQRSALQSIDLESYYRAMKRKLLQHWNPDRSIRQATVFNVEIDKSGRLTNIAIVQSSGTESFDREAMRTFRQSSPFAPLPPEFPLESLKVTWTFFIE